MTEQEQVQDAMVQFIDLANKLKNDGSSVKVVAWGLMRAAATYCTYSAVGNNAGLTESGIEKITELFKGSLKQVTAAKQMQAEQV